MSTQTQTQNPKPKWGQPKWGLPESLSEIASLIAFAKYLTATSSRG